MIRYRAGDISLANEKVNCSNESFGASESASVNIAAYSNLGELNLIHYSTLI
jgi:hypothetical protein